MRLIFTSFLIFVSCFSFAQLEDITKKNIIISKSKYKDQMYGFWLGQCIANWTGLITEMDKIGNVGEIKTGDFYTRKDWGTPEQPNIWGEDKSETISPTINFVLKTKIHIFTL